MGGKDPHDDQGRLESAGFRSAHGRLVIGGSFNYTGPANLLNDENIIILGDLGETDPERIATQKKFAAYALAEIDRIVRDHV